MLCEKCRQQPAEVAIREQERGQSRELYVCKACAGAPLEKHAAPLVEMIFDIAFQLGIRSSEAVTIPGELACSVCGMSRREFRKRERLGCEACYAAFSRDTEAMIRDMHQGRRHTGKVPVREAAVRRRSDLEQELKHAVAAQQYEEAARLRDQIKHLCQGAGSACNGEAHHAVQ